MSSNTDTQQLLVHLGKFRAFLPDEVAYFQACIRAVLQGLEGEVKEKIETTLKAPECNVEHDESYRELCWHLSDIYPVILKKALFSSVFFFFEKTLIDIADAVAEQRPRGVSRKDLKGSGIEQARDYLKKVQAIDFPDRTPEWSTILQARDIRNCLAHEDGAITDSPKSSKISNFCSSHPDWIELRGGMHIVPTEFGCLSLLHTAENFLNTLVNIIDPNYEKMLLSLLTDK